jgi:hypothetical protein
MDMDFFPVEQIDHKKFVPNINTHIAKPSGVTDERHSEDWISG